MDTLSEVISIKLPTFHPKQVQCFRETAGIELVALRAGRRWGKNVLGETIAADSITKSELIGWFAPEYKRLSETYENIVQMIEPIKARGSSKQEGVIRTITEGRVDFWSLEDENAGRGRKYHKVIIDEAAFTKPGQMLDTWERSIKPTLVDYAGSALIMSNTAGIDPDNFFYTICNDPKKGFKVFHAPSRTNPVLPLRKRVETFDEWVGRRLAYWNKLKADTPPLVYEQEYRAEFVDWSGNAFFAREHLLVNRQPVEFPFLCETVFAIIDSATKTGKKNDGTGVVFFALVRDNVQQINPTNGIAYLQHRLVILDWDLIQIEGDLLITWLPNVFTRLEELARECRARMGSMGAMIEDKASGMILLQQAQRRGWAANAIDSKLTGVGKDERAISVSGYVYRNLIKISRVAYDKVSTYKGTTRNHLLGQVEGFRVGDKDATREDDLLDCFCYGIAIALGNNEGF